MKRYRVRYLTEATEALRAAFLHVREDAGPRRAANWLSRIYASIDQLEIAPRATRAEGLFHGHEFRSKLVMSHRVFFTIDEDAMTVHIIDFVHTALVGVMVEPFGRRRSRAVITKAPRFYMFDVGVAGVAGTEGVHRRARSAAGDRGLQRERSPENGGRDPNPAVGAVSGAVVGGWDRGVTTRGLATLVTRSAN